MTPEFPYFSVIIPTYSRPKQLASYLNSLCRLKYPVDRFEVIVVDDGSETPLKEAVSSVENKLNIRIVRQSNSGPASARNHGAQEAKGDFLAFTDDDCLPAPDWLNALACQFASTPDHAIGGRTINDLKDNSYSAASQMLIEYLYGYYNRNPGNAHFIASNNLAFPAEMFRKIGGFDVRFMLVAGEDRELCDRWLFLGHRISYVPEAVVYHAHALSFFHFCRQHFNYGRGAFDFHRARASRNQSPVKVEPFSFYVELLRYPFSKISAGQAGKISILFVISQASNAAGFFWASLGS
jgi:glycosyltransferase involved in cell wall biosynthesis